MKQESSEMRLNLTVLLQVIHRHSVPKNTAPRILLEAKSAHRVVWAARRAGR